MSIARTAFRRLDNPQRRVRHPRYLATEPSNDQARSVRKKCEKGGFLVAGDGLARPESELVKAVMNWCPALAGLQKTTHPRKLRAVSSPRKSLTRLGRASDVQNL